MSSRQTRIPLFTKKKPPPLLASRTSFRKQNGALIVTNLFLMGMSMCIRRHCCCCYRRGCCCLLLLLCVCVVSTKRYIDWLRCCCLCSRRGVLPRVSSINRSIDQIRKFGRVRNRNNEYNKNVAYHGRSLLRTSYSHSSYLSITASATKTQNTK